MSVLAADADLEGLRDAQASKKVSVYLREMWDRRSYVTHVAKNELRSRQITNVLGNLWHLLNPALTIAVFYVVFGLILNVQRGTDNFIAFLTVGLFVFQFTQKATLDGAKSIVNNKGIIKAVQFPRALMPVSSTLTELLAGLSTYAVMFAVALLSGESPRATWPLFAAVVALQFVFNMGAAMVAARMATHFFDTIQILPFMFRLLLYGSGVIFSVDAYVVDNAAADVLFTLNPMYCFINLGRWTILGGDLRLDLLLSAVLWSIGLLIAGFLWFRAGEESYARD